MDLDTIIQRAKEKDSRAFDILYRMYYPKMVGICMNITKEDRATADDLVHDAFIMAFVSIGSLRNNAKFLEWLTSIVRNVALKHIEQRTKISVQSLSSIKEGDASLVDLYSVPDADLEHKELLELISLLPDGYRKILRLSVIEGFSHKEISEMLGIEPHSSSSQLSRAKSLLKRIINNRTASVIAILLLPFAWYVISHYGGKRYNNVVRIDSKRNRHTKSRVNDSVTSQSEYPADSSVMNVSVPIRQDNLSEEIVMTTDSDTVAVCPQSIVDDVLITESADDTLSIAIDSVLNRLELPNTYMAEKTNKKSNKWQMLASGSLGSALVQNVYRLLSVDNSLLPETDWDIERPEQVGTWEEYNAYLFAIPSPTESAEMDALIDIASHNSGDIIEREHYDKPITFSIALTKSLSPRWSVETGLQYSILRSQFSMGENGYSLVDKQKTHYLGIPLRVSYSLMGGKHLSVYGSAGVTMHIPVYGKVDSNYYVDWQSVYSDKKHITPSMQWQTGVSLGLQYKFTPNTSLFVEPTYNWFIPSGSETRTIWTEHPFVITCPFGLRITW